MARVICRGPFAPVRTRSVVSRSACGVKLRKQMRTLCGTSNTRSNNSFNRSANSMAFIRENMLAIMARRARLIRALDR